ncbi:MAG TPA: hypothetical protein VIY49_15685 [Bryobacteraceae bacterium]
MPELVKTSPEMAIEYARWFVNRRAYVLQSETPHPASGRHYYYRPRKRGGELPITPRDIQRHLAGEITLGIYAINPRTQRVKWMAIDADYRRALEDLLKLQFELGQNGIQAALEQSRRGGHLWIFFEQPVLAKHARVYIRYLAKRLSVEVKGSGIGDGIELFPKQDLVEGGQFGNAIRGPLGIHRAANRHYWFYGAAYELEAQMEYLRNLRRVTEEQMRELIATVPEDPTPLAALPCHKSVNLDRPHFEILDYIGTRRRVGRNWVARCPSCASEGRDRSKDNLAISVEEPWKYICWAGCTKEQIRAALGAPIPIARR